MLDRFTIATHILNATALLATGTSGTDAPLAPQDLMPLEAREQLFSMLSGENEGSTRTLELSAVDGTDRWRLSLEGSNVIVLRVADDGAYLIEELTVPDEGKRIVYGQAPPLLPARIEPGVEVERTGRAQVYDLETGEASRQGTYRHRFQRVTRARLPVEGGWVDGYLVRLQHTVEFDMATLDLQLECGFRENDGLVYRRLQYTVEKLGVFGDTTTRSYGLAEREAAVREGGGRTDYNRGMITVGMNYSVRPGKQSEFEDKFRTVLEVLRGADGHVESKLFHDVDDDASYLIFSEWSQKDDFVRFIRSPAFRDVTDWGKAEILTERPKHTIYTNEPAAARP